MKVTKSSGTGGVWLKKDELKTGDIMKIVSEATEVEGQNGIQLVAKCRIKGAQGDAVNFAINNASKNALIDAFGDDTALWMNKELTIETERGIFAGKRGIALYVVPDGFKVSTDDAGYVVIKREGSTPVSDNGLDEINPEDIPFNSEPSVSLNQTFIFTKEVRGWGVEAGDYYNPQRHSIVGGTERLLKEGVIEPEYTDHE